MHMTNHSRFKTLCKDKHMWDSLQNDFQCCGLSDPWDWIMSSLNALPMSCCNKLKFKTDCESKIGINKTLGNDQIQIRRDIYPILWQRNCIRKIQQLTSQRKTLWTAIPLIILLLETFLIAFSSYLVDIIRAYTDYIHEVQERANADHPELAKLKSKQMKYHLIPESERSSPATSQTDQEPKIPK